MDKNMDKTTIEQEIQTAANQGKSSEERLTSAFSKVGDLIKQHSGNPDNLRTLGNHLSSGPRNLVQSIIKT